MQYPPQTPPPQQGLVTRKRVAAVLCAIIAVVYLLNPTGGIIELIPDNFPVIGNLDEASATALLIWAINTLRRGT